MQSFLRGWICRRKWKTIIQDYIRSPHAESMRKRNQVVFSMLDSEAEYVQQLHILVNNFLRPLRMAASSKKPPITHDDVSSIFLNRSGPISLNVNVSPQPSFITVKRHIFNLSHKSLDVSWRRRCVESPLVDISSLRAGNAA